MLNKNTLCEYQDIELCEGDDSTYSNKDILNIVKDNVKY